MQDIKVRFVAAGPSSSHCILGDMDGKLYTWGRNEVSADLHACLCSMTSRADDKRDMSKWASRLSTDTECQAL